MRISQRSQLQRESRVDLPPRKLSIKHCRVFRISSSPSQVQALQVKHFPLLGQENRRLQVQNNYSPPQKPLYKSKNITIQYIEEQEQSHGTTTSRPKSLGIQYNCPLGALDKSTLRYNLLPKNSSISISLPSRERAMLLSN